MPKSKKGSTKQPENPISLDHKELMKMVGINKYCVAIYYSYRDKEDSYTCLAQYTGRAFSKQEAIGIAMEQLVSEENHNYDLEIIQFNATEEL